MGTRGTDPQRVLARLARGGAGPAAAELERAAARPARRRRRHERPGGYRPGDWVECRATGVYRAPCLDDHNVIRHWTVHPSDRPNGEMGCRIPSTA